MVDGAVPRIIRFKRQRANEMLTAGDAPRMFACGDGVKNRTQWW